MQSFKSAKKGFTLIELLVVVSIIALLAAILMPSLTQARESAKAAACIANMHTVGLQLLTYENSNNGYFPTASSYINGSSSAAGYEHWTAAVNPQFYKAAATYYNTASDTTVGYPTASPEYVCPSHTPQGFAPNHFTTTRIPNPPPGQTSSPDFVGDDMQAPRLSYIPNEVILPRKKYSAAYDAQGNAGKTTSGLTLVSADVIDHPQMTILAGEFSDVASDILGASNGSSTVGYKTNRPTNALRSSQSDGGAGVFDGETYTSDNSTPGTVKIYQLTIAEATADFAAAAAAIAGGSAGATIENMDKITYINPTAHASGSNYLFTDGHANKYSLADTLNPNAYLWGTHVWSCADQPEIQQNTGQ